MKTKDEGMGERWERRKGDDKKVSTNTAYEPAASRADWTVKRQRVCEYERSGKERYRSPQKRDEVRKEQTVAEWPSVF